MAQKPANISELKKEFGPPKNVNVVHGRKLSKMDKLALLVTERIGTMGFFFIIFVWTVSWLGWNIVAPRNLRFDPFPAFVLWLFISNMIQILLMPLIMVGQNLQGRHAEARAEADFEVNTKAELEIETILLHLERQNELILKIINHLETEEGEKNIK